MEKNENTGTEMQETTETQIPPEPVAVDIDKIVSDCIKFIEDNSVRGNFIVAEDIKTAYNLSDEDVAKTIAMLKTDPNMVELVDGENKYIYSRKKMFDTYAYLKLSIMKGEFEKIIVETVRQNAKLYPSPTPLGNFQLQPYNLSPEQMNDLIRKILENKTDYPDIEFFVGFDEHDYLVSTDHMSLYWAKDWVEYETTKDP